MKATMAAGAGAVEARWRWRDCVSHVQQLEWMMVVSLQQRLWREDARNKLRGGVVVVVPRGGCGGSCADVSAGASWLLILTCNGGAGTSMVAASVAGEGGVRDGAIGCKKKMVAPPLLQIGGGR
ncbi:hypothetical protein DEO72_LG1g2286 [Vigna unguiculata]|uniref:Uncharacterized protein n=1 Tax=Vigna unguiculata TaxID=3917 RepID=A0A4D6KPP8_VIGUN|nr:hypothetical protein DEO72_LG1g2286 [Vigna unguiculata]